MIPEWHARLIHHNKLTWRITMNRTSQRTESRHIKTFIVCLFSQSDCIARISYTDGKVQGWILLPNLRCQFLTGVSLPIYLLSWVNRHFVVSLCLQARLNSSRLFCKFFALRWPVLNYMFIGEWRSSKTSSSHTSKFIWKKISRFSFLLHSLNSYTSRCRVLMFLMA